MHRLEISAFRARLVGCALALGVASCASPPEPGEWGRFRFMGHVPGAAPVAMIPPTADRDGNLYAIYGSPDLPVVEAFVGRATGGWAGGCTNTKGDAAGLHGWVGHDQSRALYWSGDALVVLSGSSGGCSRLLDVDPSSGASLAFRAVVPRVRVTPSRTSVVAMVQAPTDPRPYTVVVDVDTGVYTRARAFAPTSAERVTVIGVGADHEAGGGVILVRYEDGDGSAAAQARFVDDEGEVIAQVRLGDLAAADGPAVLGYLQADDAGLFAGLLDSNEILVLDKSGGARKAVKGMTPVGVHRWEGELWLVGLRNDRPVVAPIDGDGRIGKVRSWTTSRSAAAALKGAIEVVDDRQMPSRDLTWRSPRSAVGSHPFLSAHSPDPYADGATIWLVAGPSFAAGGAARTGIALAPVGLSYP